MTSDDQRPNPTSAGVPEPAPPALPSATWQPGGQPPAPPAPPAFEPPAPGGPPAPPAPGGVYPAGSTVYGTPPTPVATRPEPAPRKGLIAGVGVAALVVGGLFLKFGLPILVGTTLSGVLGGVFGGPFDKLPSDQKQALEQRITTAMGDRLKGRSDAEVTAEVRRMMTAGMPRLGDELLVEKIHLTSKLLGAADEATCASIARSTAKGASDDAAMSKALGALDVPSIGRWFNINIAAIEAEAQGSQPVRTQDQAEAERVLADGFARFSATEMQELETLYDGGGASDTVACDAFRALYRHIAELPPADLAIAALYDVSP